MYKISLIARCKCRCEMCSTFKAFVLLVILPLQKTSSAPVVDNFRILCNYSWLFPLFRIYQPSWQSTASSAWNPTAMQRVVNYPAPSTMSNSARTCSRTNTARSVSAPPVGSDTDRFQFIAPSCSFRFTFSVWNDVFFVSINYSSIVVLMGAACLSCKLLVYNNALRL